MTGSGACDAPQPATRLAVLARVGSPVRYPQGSTIFREGDRSDHVVLVVSGVAKVFTTAASGYQTVLAFRSGGEIIGEFAAFDRRPRSATAVALTDIACMLVTGDRFRRCMRTDPDLAFTLLCGLVERLREADRRRMEFGAYDLTQRLCRLLIELTAHATAAGSAPDATAAGRVVTLSQQELAGTVGASREAVARVLRALREQGAISTARLRIRVLRPELLRRHCGPGSAPSPSGAPKGGHRHAC